MALSGYVCIEQTRSNDVDTKPTTIDYEAPQLNEIGSLHELTLQNKDTGAGDGFFFQGVPIHNVS